MKNTWRRFALFGWFALSLVPAKAATMTWNFTGTCIDCPGMATGTFTATPNSFSTIFSFSYTSDWISYTMQSPVVSVDEGPAFFGLGFTYTPGQSLYLVRSSVDVTSFGGVGNPLAAGLSQRDMYFTLGSNGNWSTGEFVPADFGTNGVMTLQGEAVPEPSTLALAGLGAVALGVFERRRKRQLHRTGDRS